MGIQQNRVTPTLDGMTIYIGIMCKRKISKRFSIECHLLVSMNKQIVYVFSQLVLFCSVAKSMCNKVDFIFTYLSSSSDYGFEPNRWQTII